MKIAYLTNVYPAPSHSFIRREILAHEAAGHEIKRFSVRRFSSNLEDPLDQQESGRTKVLLDAGPFVLLFSTVKVALASPGKFLKAFAATRQLSRASRRGLRVHLAYLAEACVLRRWLTQEKIDHLHVHFGTNPTAVAMICRILGGPSYSFTVHGPDEFDEPTALSLDRKIAHAAFTVAVSEYGMSQLYRWVRSHDYHKIKVVHCGLDRSFLDTPPTPVPETSQLLFVGRLTTTKGIRVLLHAMSLLGTQGLKPKLKIIGDGPEKESLVEEIRRLALGEQITFCGWQSSASVQREIIQSRALILPSFAEGLPVVLMESLVLSRPVVATWVAGVPELVEDNASGWLVPPGSAEALADALKKVMSLPIDKLTEMGLRGREKVFTQHDAAIEAAKLAELFQKAIEPG